MTTGLSRPSLSSSKDTLRTPRTNISLFGSRLQHVPGALSQHDVQQMHQQSEQLHKQQRQPQWQQMWPAMRHQQQTQRNVPRPVKCSWDWQMQATSVLLSGLVCVLQLQVSNCILQVAIKQLIWPEVGQRSLLECNAGTTSCGPAASKLCSPGCFFYNQSAQLLPIAVAYMQVLAAPAHAVDLVESSIQSEGNVPSELSAAGRPNAQASQILLNRTVGCC